MSILSLLVKELRSGTTRLINILRCYRDIPEIDSEFVSKLSHGVEISEGKTTLDCIVYFLTKYKKQKKFIESLLEKYDLYGKSCLSIASGFGAEEMLFSQLGNMEVHCIEKDKKATLVHGFFVKNMNEKRNFIYNVDMGDFKSEKTFDLIYTSSPSNWTHESLSVGIPDYFLKLINRHSHSGSYFIVNMYGGGFKFRSKSFLNQLPDLKDTLEKKLESIGYGLLDLWTYNPRDDYYQKRGGILVARR